jgi:PST family polysaccharide transporter
LLIGKFLGAESLGLYSLTFKIVFFPIQHISAVVSRVMFPALSRLNDSIADVVASYQKTVMAISFVTFPMMVGCFAVAEDLVVVVLGPEWIDAIPLIRILCWVGLIQSVSTTVGILFQSQGRPDIALRFNLLYAAPSMLLATLLGLPWGVVGIAIATLIRAIPLSYIAHSLANQLINLRMTEFYRVLVPQLVLALLMLAVVLLLPPPVSSEGPVVRLVFTVIEGVAVYMFCSVFMFRSAINDRLSPQR